MADGMTTRGGDYEMTVGAVVKRDEEVPCSAQSAAGNIADVLLAVAVAVLVRIAFVRRRVCVAVCARAVGDVASVGHGIHITIRVALVGYFV